MFMTPAGVVLSLFRGLLAIAILIGAVWLGVYWYRHLPEFAENRVPDVPAERNDADAKTADAGTQPVTERRPLGPFERIAAWKPGADSQTLAFATALLLLVWCSAGRIIHPVYLLASSGDPRPPTPAAEVQRVKMLNGTQLHTETRGPADAPVVVLTHGWSLSNREWDYLEQHWQGRFRTIVWDLPGLGQSTQPENRDFSLETLARALRSVIDSCTTGPVILVGHSIGGMIILTFCRLFPELLGTRVSKLVLIHTTYTNPLRTMRFAGLFTALQKPLVEPLLYLQIACSPIVRIMNWLSYWNGTVQSSVIRNGFGRKPTRQKVDFIAKYYPYDSPAVLARGALGMLAYDATETLPSIQIPVLVVGAKDDPITLNDASETIHSRIPHSRLHVLAATKHFGLIEDDQATAKVIAEFCS